MRIETKQMRVERMIEELETLIHKVEYEVMYTKDNVLRRELSVRLLRMKQDLYYLAIQ